MNGKYSAIHKYYQKSICRHLHICLITRSFAVFVQGFDAECKTFWNDQEPNNAADADLSTCYESGYETNSWWMTRLSHGAKLVTQIILTGNLWH